MKPKQTVAVFAATFAFLVLILGVATYLLLGDSGTSGEDGASGAGAAPRERTLQDAPQARFLSIFSSSGDGSLSSYLVGGKTDEFNAFGEAIAGARPADGASDETYADLLVLSFGEDDTLEISYSRAHNRFILGDVIYEPATELAPMIESVEQKFNNTSPADQGPQGVD